MVDKYIYKNKNGKLVLPDFLYEICSGFELTGNSNASDFSVYAVSKLAGKIDTFDSNFDSDTLNYYSGLYDLIKKEGGIHNCEMLSDYTQGNDKTEIVNQLIEAGIIIQEQVEVDKNGQLLLTSAKNHEDNKWIAVQDFYILRNSEKYLILPDEVYNEYKNFDGDDSYSFAKKLLKIKNDKIPDNLTNIYNFYSAIFKLIEKEGRCIILSDFCKKQEKSNKAEFLQQMINSKHAYLSLVEIDKRGKIKENRLNGTCGLEESIYLANTTDENEEFYSYLDTQISDIEEKLKNITDEFSSLSSEKYKELSLKIKNLKAETYAFYKKALKMAKSYKDLMEFAESKFNKLMNKIEFEDKKLIKEYNNQKKAQEEQYSIDYFEKITKSIDEVDAEITQINETMVVKSDKDYMAYNSKLTALRDKLYEIFDASLQSAYDDGSLTLSIVKEASTKHNAAIKNVNETIEKLEDLKNKITFNNIFNT